jgi:DNA repair protein RadA
MVQLRKNEGGLNGKALFIDTESTFTTERLASIAEVRGLDKNEDLKNVIPARAMSTSEQEHYLETIGTIIDKHKNIRLLIVDCVTSLYRAEFIGRAALPERQQRLHRHMQMLQRFSEVYEVAVVVSNQVNEAPNPFAGSLIRNKPIGGNIMAHDSTYRVGLRQFGDKRIAELIHSPHLPENQAYFQVSEKGVLDMANFW